MALPGMNPENHLPGYDFARMTGNGAADFDFKALGAAMDCNRDFYQAGIIYSDGNQRYVVRPTKRYPNGQSGIATHVIVTKAASLPSASTAGKALTEAVSSTSMGTEIASTVLSCGAMIITGGVMLAGSAATPLTAGGVAYWSPSVMPVLRQPGCNASMVCIEFMIWSKTVVKPLVGSIPRSGMSRRQRH